MNKPISSARNVKSKPAKLRRGAAAAEGTSSTGKVKSNAGTPGGKPSQFIDSRRLDWMALFVTGIGTGSNSKKGRCEVDVAWEDDDNKTGQLHGLERGYGKTMAQAFRQALDQGMKRCGW